MRLFILVVFFLYLLLMLKNMIKGKHTAPLEFCFLERPEVDNTYAIWWVVYVIGFIVYLTAFVILASSFF